jgi:hypothetical protein
MSVRRWWVAVAAVMVGTAVAGCGAGGSGAPAGSRAGEPASAGAAGLGGPAASMPELAGRIQAATGGCAEVTPRSPVDAERLGEALGGGPFADEAAPVWLPHVAELASCRASRNGQGALYMIRFREGAFDDFQAAWRDFIRGQQTGNLDVVFGNGYAVHAVADTQPAVIAGLHLRYLRCKPVGDNAEKLPADVEGCVFSNVRGQ